MLLPDRFEDLPKLVEDILQTSVSTGPRGALRMVQGIQAFIGVGGEWLADVSKVTGPCLLGIHLVQLSIGIVLETAH